MLCKALTVAIFYRYSDVLVHRLLAVAINADTSFADLFNKKKVQVC